MKRNAIMIAKVLAPSSWRAYCTRIYNILLITVVTLQLQAQNKQLVEEVEQGMMSATKYMVEEVSTNGGYLWYYLPDFSRQWGEMEAYKTMIWLQHPGTISMGHVFLDAYHATGDEYYYKAAEKAASAVIWGQGYEGGWNYLVDFAGDRSLKHWYNTIGKNGWRLEEFQHYYGNSTFDDDVTSDAARFLLRMYLEKLDATYKPPLDKAIEFILMSQYPMGGWPQRYPLKYDFSKNGCPDYSSFYTYNDDVIWENIHFLLQCYLTLGGERLLDPIHRGMNFYLISQHASGGWAQQYDMDLNPAGARSYEPIALLPQVTFENAMLLLEFYKITGNKKYLNQVPAAIEWLEKTSLPGEKTLNGRYTHSTFVELNTDRPIYVHRKGSNAAYGYYYSDYEDSHLLSHYGGKTSVPVEVLKQEYARLSTLSIEELTADSPLKVGAYAKEVPPQKFYNLNRESFDRVPDTTTVKRILNSLDDTGRWLMTGGMTSHPYVGDGQNQELTENYASINEGDETDTSPYRDTTDQEYLSTGKYIMNMRLLINFIESEK
jgi:PelA/Pel-15E family pectate lyase